MAQSLNTTKPPLFDDETEVKFQKEIIQRINFGSDVLLHFSVFTNENIFRKCRLWLYWSCACGGLRSLSFSLSLSLSISLSISLSVPHEAIARPTISNVSNARHFPMVTLSHVRAFGSNLLGQTYAIRIEALLHFAHHPLILRLLLSSEVFASGHLSQTLMGERQSIAQKGVRAIDARNSWLENGSNAAKTIVRAPRLSADEREHAFV